MDKSSSLGIPMSPKIYPISTSVKAWGCPRYPHLHQQNIRSFLWALYFYCFIYYVLFLELQLFLFSVQFAFCSIQLDPSNIFLERDMLRFHCLEHSSFHSYQCSPFASTTFSPCFPIVCCLELVSFLLLSSVRSLVYLSSVSLRVVSNKSIGVGKE